MKAIRPIVVVLAAVAIARADEALPKAFPAGRYDAMATRSPFAAPTAATPPPTPPPVAAGPHWWDQMFVTSLMDRGGVYFAALVDKSSNKHYVLQLNKLDPDSQFLLGSVQWNEHIDQTTVTVSKGAETAPPLRFDVSVTAAAPVPQRPVAPTGPANSPTMPTNRPLNPPAGFPNGPPPPPPSTTSVVRRPTINVTSPQNNGPGVPPTNGPRRLVVPSSSDDQ